MMDAFIIYWYFSFVFMITFVSIAKMPWFIKAICLLISPISLPMLIGSVFAYLHNKP